MESYCEILSASPLFSGIRPPEIKVLLDCLAPVRCEYEKNSFIFSAGDAVRAFGMVLTGCVHIVQEDYWGNRTILTRVQPGELFGEALSCAEVERVPVGAVACEPSRVLLLDAARILTVCSSSCGFHTRLIRNMVGILADKNLMLTQKMEIITRRSTRQRLLAYLSAQAQQANSSRFDIPFNRQELADYLAVERSAMSAELSRMQREGLLRTNRNTFELMRNALHG